MITVLMGKNKMKNRQAAAREQHDFSINQRKNIKDKF